MAVEMLETAARYIEDVMKMDDSRWPKKCVREEIRGVINGDATKWGKELRGYGRGGKWGNMEYHKKCG